MNNNQNNSSLITWVLIPLFILVCFLLYFGSRLNTVNQDLRYQTPIVRTTSDALTLHPVRGQTIYVPAYSHVYHQNGMPHLLTVTLSVRNTSFENEIILTSVRYFNTNGKEVRSHLAKPLTLAPLATTEFLVERNDTSGGSGASFIIEWIAGKPVTEPIVETVMIDTSGQQGISFARSGTIISEKYSQNKKSSD